MGHDVFLSYSSKDQARAEAVAKALEARSIRVWMAPHNIPPGAVWKDEILKAIDSVKIFLLLYTESAKKSKHVEREISYACELDKHIIPLRLTTSELPRSFKYALTGVHWLDGFPGPFEGHLEKLAEHTCRFLAKSDKPRRDPQAGKRPSDGAPRPQEKPLPEKKMATPPVAGPSLGAGKEPFYRNKIAVMSALSSIAVLVIGVFVASTALFGNPSTVILDAVAEIPKVLVSSQSPGDETQDPDFGCGGSKPLCYDIKKDHSRMLGDDTIAGYVENVVTINTLYVDGKYLVLAGVGAGSQNSAAMLKSWLGTRTVSCTAAPHGTAKYDCDLGDGHESIAGYIWSHRWAARLVEKDDATRN